MTYTNYTDYTNIDPTEYALQTNMSQPTQQSNSKTPQQKQLITQNQTSNQQFPNIKTFYKQGLLTGLKNFFNVQTGTVLVFTICFCLGGAFKDLVQNIIINIVQPLIVKLLLLTNIYNFSVISDIISEKDSILNITGSIAQFISFVILLITVYFIFVLTNTVP